MGKMLEDLFRLQSIERELARVRRRLRARQNAVSIQQRRIDQLREEWEALNERAVARRKDADRLELDLKTSEGQVSKFRSALNSAKTNKEYAAILTHINTRKADNAKLEDEILRIMQDVDAVKAEADKTQEQIDAETKRLDQTKQTSAEEVARLEKMMAELSSRRAEATRDVDSETLTIFERVAEKYDGEAMAPIAIQGKKPPHTYICAGCNMGLTAEHANALRVRDEIRRCDNCGRILYLEPTEEPQT